MTYGDQPVQLASPFPRYVDRLAFREEVVPHPPRVDLYELV